MTRLLSFPSFVLYFPQKGGRSQWHSDSSFLDKLLHMKNRDLEFTVLVYQNVSIRIPCRKKPSNFISSFLALPYISTLYTVVMFFFSFFFFCLLEFVEMAKVKLMQLSNKNCGLDILQGHLNLGIADALVATETDESTRSHFSECSAMNWWLTFGTYHEGKRLILPLIAFKSKLLLFCSPDQATVFSTGLSDWNSSSHSL